VNKSIGGLIASNLKGGFIHTNTIEEYNAIDMNKVVAEEAQKVIENSEDFKEVNRFVVVAFGDLKNYLYIHR
jgi:hypothetical protein